MLSTHAIGEKYPFCNTTINNGIEENSYKLSTIHMIGIASPLRKHNIGLKFSFVIN